MSQWIDRVRQHPVWAALGAVDPSIKAALERDSIAADIVDSLERLRTVVKYGDNRLSGTDPALVPPAAINNLVQQLNQMKAHIDSFTVSGDVSQIDAANEKADTFLANLNLIPGVATVGDLTAISEAAGAYRQTLEKHLGDALILQNDLLDRAAKIEAKITAIEATLNTEQQRLASLVTEQQSQFSAAQDKRGSEFAASQAEYLAKYTAVSVEQTTQFSTDQDSRRTAFADLQRESQEKLSTLMAEYDKKLKDHDENFQTKEKLATEEHKANVEALNAQYVTQASTILGQITKHKQDVESLVGVIGNLGVTSGYKKVADYARFMVVFWQITTVLALAGLIVVAFLVAFPGEFGSGLSADRVGQQKVLALRVDVGSKENVTATSDKKKDAQPELKATAEVTSKPHTEADFYQSFATRVFLSITFGIFAAYAGRQASRFFDMEQKNRKLALELEALGPFIEPLDKPDRDKFRVQIGDRSFGVPDHDASKPKDDDPVTLVGWIKSKDGIEVISKQIKEAFKGFSK